LFYVNTRLINIFFGSGGQTTLPEKNSVPLRFKVYFWSLVENDSLVVLTKFLKFLLSLTNLRNLHFLPSRKPYLMSVPKEWHSPLVF